MVNSERYVSMIEVFSTQTPRNRCVVPTSWSYNSHIARTSVNFLWEHFPEQLITLRGVGLHELSKNLWLAEGQIRIAIADIGTDMLEKVDRNFEIRLF